MGKLQAKPIELQDTRPSAYIELPVGTWTIGDKKYTVVDVNEPNWEGTATITRRVIDLIEPATAPAPAAAQ